MQKMPVNSKDISPFTEQAGRTVAGQMNIVSAIALLLRSCGPSAVPRLVVFVAIDAVNRHSRSRGAPHVCDEMLKLHPSLTDCYSSSTVERPKFCRWERASRNHSVPRAIFRSSAHSVSLACLAANASTFAPKASATFNVSCKQAVPPDDFFATASAHALPLARVSFYSSVARSFSNNSQPSEGLSGETSEFSEVARRVTLREHSTHAKWVLL